MTDYAGLERAKFLRGNRELRAPLLVAIAALLIDGTVWVAIGISIGYFIWR